MGVKLLDNPIEIVIDVIIAIIIIVLFPLLYLGMKQDTLTQTIVEIETDEFVQEVRGKGYIDKNLYEEYIKKLSATGILYDVSLEHTHNSLEPEYRFRTKEEVLEEQKNSYTGTNEYHYLPISTDIPHIEDPIDNSGNLNSETNESVMASATDDPADPNHIHDEGCYSGHKHIGNNGYIHKHTHVSGKACRRYIQSIHYDVRCRACGVEYSTCAAWYYLDDGKLVTAWTDLSGIKNCYDCNRTSLVTTKHDSYGYACDYEEDFDGDGYNDDVPVGEEREYHKSTPLAPEDGYFLLKDGCYLWHRSWTFNQLREKYKYDDDNEDLKAFRKLTEANFQNICTVPLIYNIGLAYVENANRGLPPTSYVTYKAFLDGNILKFSFEGYKISGQSYKSDNPGFPEVLSKNEFINMSSTNNAIRDFFVKYIDHNMNISNQGRAVSLSSSILTICPHPRSNSLRAIPICGYEEDGTVDCDKIIVSIIPTHEVQTIYINDPLITTARATYKDGSKKTILCTTDFDTSKVVTNKQATLTYNYEIDGVAKTIQTTITVSTILRNKTCHNGHVYNLNSDNTDPGCPFCRGYLQSLVVYYPSSGSITIYKGTTLKENEVTLLATYMDGRQEYLKTEYVDNLDKDYIGTQTATLSYKGLYTSLSVTIKRNLKLCPICNRYYELYPDNSDPGCPFCAARTPIFTGNVLEYDNKYYERDILKEIYNGKGVYYFSDKDYLLMRVKNRTNGWGRGLIKNIFKSLGNEYINVVDGGYIREEVEK